MTIQHLLLLFTLFSACLHVVTDNANSVSAWAIALVALAILIDKLSSIPPADDHPPDKRRPQIPLPNVRKVNYKLTQGSLSLVVNQGRQKHR